MTTISELVGALLDNQWDDAAGKSGKRNYTDLDRQIAGSIGVKLGNNTRDHRILKLLSDVREYLQGVFRQDFEAALEWEITYLQDLQKMGLTSEQFDTAVAYAKRLVKDRVRHRFTTVEVQGLATPYHLLGRPPDTRRGDGHVEIYIDVDGLVGAKLFDPKKERYHTRPGSSDDAKKIARAFQPIIDVDLKPFLDLQARRLGRPSINELHRPVHLPGGVTFFHAYEVNMGYRARIPLEMMHALYGQSQKTPTS